MRSDRVVCNPPLFDQNLCFAQRIKDLTVEKLVAQFAVEAFNIPVLPGTPRRNVQRVHADLLQPVAHRFGRKLGSIIRTNMRWHTSR